MSEPVNGPAPSGRAQAIGLLGLGAYLPERVMTNADWEQLVDTSDAWITQRTGIERRRFAAKNESTVDLATQAARRALEHAQLDARDIDEIIVATDTPDVYSPDTAAFLQHRLGARQIPAYDLGGSGCAGFLQALDVARTRAAAADLGSGRKILVIGVELLSRNMDWTDRTTCVLFGDGAGAVVVGAADHGGAPVAREIAVVITGTDGSQAEILGLQGGSRQTSPGDAPNGGMKILMHGPKVFKEAVRRMTTASRQVLRRAQLTLSDIDLVIPHQANRRILSAVAKSLGVPEEKLFVNVHELGNTGSASVPIALAQAYEQGQIQKGDRVLLASFGAGFHWGAALIRF